MNQLAIIGISSFSSRVLDQLLAIDGDVEILVIDKDEERISAYKALVQLAIIADVLNEATVKEYVPADVDCAVVDVGDNMEVSILVTNYLKKMGVRRIIARAENPSHGEILEVVGAHQVIYPDDEAAKRLVPSLLFSSLSNYFPMGPGLVFAEITLDPDLVGTKVADTDIRKDYDLNIIAVRNPTVDDGIYRSVGPVYVFEPDDRLLLGGSEEAIAAYAHESTETIRNKGSFWERFRRLLG